MLFDNEILSSGTAFIGKTNNFSLLFTNRHNVTGRNNETGEYLSKTGGIPNKIRILFPLPEKTNSDSDVIHLDSWQPYTFNLYKDDYFEKPLWIEHPLRDKVDVVGIVLPLINPHIINLLAFDVSEGWYDWKIGELINVLGFPYGLSIDRFPIWMTGYIASEPSIDYNELPIFLIDCRTRRGQSGSPVIGRFKPGHIVEYQGKAYQYKKETTHLLGIYSGRINAESDLGKVWKTEVLRTIMSSGIQVCTE